MRAIVKTFPGVRALDGVDLVLRAGEVHALMGENGAGKSTLIKVLTGVYPLSGGEIHLEGRAIAPRSPADAQTLGISTVYQEVNLVPDLSVAENLFLGRQPRTWGCIRWGEIRRRATEALRRLDLSLDVARPLGDCSIAIQQMVAIARALDVSARILVLDEPTSSLDKGEVERLFGVMTTLKRQGLAILFVTHFLDQVYAVSDRITVLRNGGLVGEYNTAELPKLQLVSKMIGRELADETELERKKKSSAGVSASAASSTTSTKSTASTAPSSPPPHLVARGIGRRGLLEPCDLDIRPGEVVGLAGLLGSGRSELAGLIFGVHKPDKGSIELKGEPVRIASPRAATKRGIACLPEDRKTQGVLPHLSVRENMILSLQARLGWLRPISRKRQDELARRFIARLRVATPDAEKPIGQLSGGNQQKVILARLMLAEPSLLILDEPTRGIDIGAKVEIESLVRELCDQGLAILFISGELEEMARNCDRVLVLRDRRPVAELRGDDVNLPSIMRAIAGAGERSDAA